MADKTVAKKFKLQGSGLKNRSSKKTQEFISDLIRDTKRINKAGKDGSKNFNGTFD